MLTIVSHNYYYALPGTGEAVLKQRLHASDVRERLGLPRGRVFRKLAGGDDFPDVLWEIEFPDIAGHHADMAVRAASTEFETVRVGMRKLYRQFERPLFETEGVNGGAAFRCMRLDAATVELPASRLLLRVTEETGLPAMMTQSWGDKADAVPAVGAVFERAD